MAIKKQFLKSKPVCKVRFTLGKEYAGAADSIAVAGCFNDWSCSLAPMARAKDGSFSLELELPVNDEYVFRYCVDGERWLNEPEADRYTFCEFAGTENSVLDLSLSPAATEPKAAVNKSVATKPDKAAPKTGKTAKAGAKPAKAAQSASKKK